MTTAARPTFEPARGGQGKGEKDLSAISKQYSSRDLPGHTKLKYREHGQGTAEELHSRDFRRELEDKEKDTKTRKTHDHVNSKRPRLEAISVTNLDADDPLDEDDDTDDTDSEDDSALLLAELNKIKSERAIDQARKEAERRQEEEKIRMENILSGNPLLSYSSETSKSDFKVKRRWDDDVVFKNCARSDPDKKEYPFINDSLRSAFHKKFMDKYIK